MERQFYICMLLLTISALSFVCIGTVLAEKPEWVNLGKYAEYEVVVTKSTDPEIPKGKLGTIRWEIVDVDDYCAEIKFTINILAREPLFSNMPTERTWYYDENIGFILGSEDLLALKRGEAPEDIPEYYTVRVGSEVKSTPAGYFDCYKLMISATTGSVSFNLNLWYDKSTGILVALEAELRNIGYQGHHVAESLQLTSTNAIKPSWSPWSPTIMWIVIAVVVVLVILIAVLAVRRMGTSRTPRPPPPTPIPPTPQT